MHLGQLQNVAKDCSDSYTAQMAEYEQQDRHLK